MQFCITSLDPKTGQLRTFQSAVFPGHARDTINLLLERHYAYIREIEKENSDPEPIPEKRIELHEPIRETKPNIEPILIQKEFAREQGFTGDICPQPGCGSFRMRRTGTCITCVECGFNAGCG